jgi:DtxR family Mn-dependent transcriptional regulator
VATSASVQEYLEALYNLTGGDTDRVVSTNELAAQMSVTAPSASEMLRRLEHLGLVSYLPYQGASLTGRGAGEGSRVVRYHRLWERMLVDILGMSWDEVHDEACRLEHATSPRLAQALGTFLDNPATCPHGHAVPAETPVAGAAGSSNAQAPDYTVETPEPSIPLIEAPQGFSGRVASVAEQPDLLKYCASAGLVPGAPVYVVSVHPLDELVEVSVGQVSGGETGGGETGGGGEAGEGETGGGERRTVTVGARVGRMVRVTAGGRT